MKDTAQDQWRHPFIRSIFAAAIGLLTSSAVTAQPDSDYHLTFVDEFNTGFDDSRWLSTDFHGIRNNSGDYQSQWFSDPTSAPSGYSIHNPFKPNPGGTLSIRAEMTPAGVYSGNQPYVSGMLSTAKKFTQRYGYYELKAKLPAGSGLWSRFWLLTDDGNWPGEYDIFEVLGRDNQPPPQYFQHQVRQTTHYVDGLSSHGIDGSSYYGINPIDGNFHTYGFLWEPDKVTWYVDGVKTLTQPNRINTPMYAILDLAVGNDSNWPGKVESNSIFPANMEMDYFRVYSNDPSIPRVPLPAGSSHASPPIDSGITFSNAQTTTAPRPPGWTAGDVGTVSATGSSEWNPITGEWILKGAGNTLAGSGRGQFARTTLAGNGAVTATVTDVTEWADNDASAGVSVRLSSEPNAPQISLLYTASIAWPSGAYSTRLTLRTRTTEGGPMQEVGSIASVAPVSSDAPITLRIVRNGTSFSASYSTNRGNSWNPVGSPQTIPSLSGSLTSGIGVGGNGANHDRPSRAIFTNVAVDQALPVIDSPSNRVITGGTIGLRATLQDTLNGSTTSPTGVIWSVLSGGGTIDGNGNYTAPATVGTGYAVIKAAIGSRSVTHRINIAVPSPWSVPVLVKSPPGDVGFSAGSNTWTLSGGGAGVSTTGKQDYFRFLSATVVGNDTITVRIDSTNASQTALMFRDFTERDDAPAGAGSRYAGIIRTSNVLTWATRETAGGDAGVRQSVSVPAGSTWLRIVRSGPLSETFTAYYSTNGSSWTPLGSPRNFEMTLSATAGVAIASGSLSAVSTATFSNLSLDSRTVGSPSVARVASYPAIPRPIPGSIKGITATFGVLGTDDGGEAALIYTWSATGPAGVAFSENNSNAAKSTTATFARSGKYLLTARIMDADGKTAHSTVSVTVVQTFTSISVSPPTSSISPGATRQFTAVANDQFGLPLARQRTLVWSVLSGPGSVNASGLYSAPSTLGTAVVEAKDKYGPIKSSATITITHATNLAPSVATPATASPSPVTGTTANVSALGSDSGGEPSLKYTWSSTDPTVTFTPNGTNASKNATATFSKAGTHTLTCTISNTGGLSTTTSLTVTVNQTSTLVIVDPAVTTVATSTTRQFSASTLDQFGEPMVTQPTFTWSIASGPGTINSSGLYVAPGLVGGGTATIRASYGSVSGISSIPITSSQGPSGSWASSDINASPAGNTTRSGNEWTVTGGGSAGDLWGLSGTGINGSRYSDSFRYVSKEVQGDGTLTVKLINPGAAAQVGLMFRNTTSANSRFVGLIHTNQYSAGGLALMSRSQFDYTAIHTIGVNVSFPVWLRLVRAGNTFTAFRSTDGNNWVATGTAQTLTMNASLRAGIAVSSGNATTAVTASFSDLTFNPAGNTAPTLAVQAAAAANNVTGTTANFSILGTDNGGEPALIYTWKATGPDDVTFGANESNAAKNTTATFSKAGDYTLIATVTDDGGLSATSNISVSVSQTLASIEVTPASPSMTTGSTQQFAASAKDQFGDLMDVIPIWNVSQGGGTISSNGLYTAPATVGAGSATIRAAVGTVTGTGTIEIKAPIATVPSPWSAADINSAPEGGTSFSGGNWTSTGGGSGGDMWNYAGTGINGSRFADSFHFVSRLAGDGTLTVKIDDRGNAAQVGLMLRESAAANSRYIGLIHTTQYTTPRLAWMSRSQFDYTAVHTLTSAIPNPAWLRLTRSGNAVTAFHSSDGTTWTQTGPPQTVTLSGSMLAGLAISSGNAATTSTVTYSDLTFTPAMGATSIASTTPEMRTNGSVETAYKTWISQFPTVEASLQANASDPDNDGVSNLVEFALGGAPNDPTRHGHQSSAIEDTDSDGRKELTLTISVRRAAGATQFTGTTSGAQTTVVDGLKYTVQGSRDITFANPASVSEIPVSAQLPALPEGYEYRRFRLNETEDLGSRGFLRVQIESLAD